MADFSSNASQVHLPVVDSPSHPEGGYYSHSHLARFAQCPRSYQLHYVERHAPELAPHRHFGLLVHRVLEETVRDHVQRRENGPLDADFAADSYRFAWSGSELRDHALFAEGLDFVSRWIEREGDVRSGRVLGLELPFSLHFDVTVRNEKKATLVALLQQLRGYVQSTADADVETGASTIQGAGMAVRKTPVRAARVFAAKPRDVTGSVMLVAPSAGHRASYEWQYSTDGGKTWVTMPVTLQAKTTLSGLTAATTVEFKYRPVTKTGEGDWSQPSSIVVR